VVNKLFCNQRVIYWYNYSVNKWRRIAPPLLGVDIMFQNYSLMENDKGLHLLSDLSKSGADDVHGLECSRKLIRNKCKSK
jgi:hypothetical protein